MVQGTLFAIDDAAIVAPIARHSDPIASHQSAVETEKKLNTLHQSFLCCLEILNCPSTANEVAVQCVALDGGMAESYRKRARELVNTGHIEECGFRPCQITGKNAQTFKARGH